jgi:Ion channel
MTEKKKRAKLIPFWFEDKGLSFFLGFLVFMTIFVPMVRLSRSGRIAIDLIFALIFFSGAVATIRKRILVYLAIAFTVVEFTADLIVEFYPSLGHWGWDTTLKICGLAILVVMTLKHTFRPGPISAHRVMGGVATYLLIGLTWAFGYKLLMETLPDAIHFESSLGRIPTGEPSRLIYFSFSTLTSVSYGDVRPVHRVARSLATAEALVGQLYPSVLIATLVGMSLQARSNTGMKVNQIGQMLFDDREKNDTKSINRASLKSKHFIGE